MSIIVTCECGKQYRVQDQFSGRHANCPACGNVLHIPDSPPPPAASTTLLQPRSRRPLIIGIGGGFAALVIIVIVVVWMWPSGNESNQSSQGNRLDQQVAKVPQRSKSEPNAPKKPQVIVSDKQVDQIPSRSKSEPDAPKKPLGPTMAQAETRTQWSTWRPKEPEAMALEILACLKYNIPINIS